MELQRVLIISFLFISSLGTLFHFTHGWFKRGFLLHVFSALNESTWEHMKMLLAPTLFVSLLQLIFLQGIYENFWNGVLLLLIVEILTIPILFEPLRFFIKKVPFAFTIIIFYLAIFLGLLVEYFVLKNNYVLFGDFIALVFVFLLVMLFGVFSYYPPKIFLFRDPVTGEYGDYLHKEKVLKK